MKETELVT